MTTSNWNNNFTAHSVLVIGTESCGNDIVNELGGTAKQIARSYMIFPEVSHVKKIIGILYTHNHGIF